LGPYNIEKVTGLNTRRLKLPPAVKIHPVFNVNLLEPETQKTSERDEAFEPRAVTVEEEREWEVQEVVDHKNVGRRPKTPLYRVHWVGYPSSQDTWEPIKHLVHAQDKLNAYLAKQIREGKEREEDAATKAADKETRIEA
jgi:hypothetical protein